MARAQPEALRPTGEQIRRWEWLHAGFFREVPEYPGFAWQEVIVNAFAHHDYEDQGREIEVWFFGDRMEVNSPGNLVPPVTLDALRSREPVHASRNPLLVRVLVEVGLMREEGEEIARMFEEMETSYLQGPEFAFDAATFTVTLRNEPIFAGVGTEWQEVVRGLPLSLAQRRVLLAHPDRLTNEDYRRLNGVDRDEAYRKIQEMVALGVVLPAEAPGRGAVYRVQRETAEREGRRNARGSNAGDALRAAHTGGDPVWMLERAAALRAFFSNHATLKNAGYRQLFAAGRGVAFRELRQLVRGG